MAAIYGVLKHGVVVTPPGGALISHAIAYRNTVGGEIRVSHDNGAVWAPYEPTEQDLAAVEALANAGIPTFRRVPEE